MKAFIAMFCLLHLAVCQWAPKFPTKWPCRNQHCPEGKCFFCNEYERLCENRRGLKCDGLTKKEVKEVVANLESILNNSGFENELSIRGCSEDLGELDIQFPDQPQLRAVEFAMCGIEKFHPDAFAAQKAVKDYNFEQNYLQTIPRIPHARNVESLFLHQNRITWVTAREMQNFTSLKSIRFMKNKELTFEDDAFQSVPLTSLEAMSCDLVHVPTHAIRNLTTLEWLHLQNNLIYRVGDAAFPNLPNLKNVEFVLNQIGEFSATAFKNTPRLKLINLRWNHMRHFELDGTELPSLTLIRLHTNPIESIQLRNIKSPLVVAVDTTKADLKESCVNCTYNSSLNYGDYDL